MIDKKTIKAITNFCIDKLDIEASGQGWEYYYQSMPLCVIDSVFSIGVRYEGVTNTIEKLADYYNIDTCAKRKHKIPDIKAQLSTSDFIKRFGEDTIEFLASEVFKNKQRTSTTNGILKSFRLPNSVICRNIRIK